MRVVVNNIAASMGGAMTILKDFYEYIRENDTENEWIFLLGDTYFEETDRIKIKIFPAIKKSPVKKLIFDFFTGRYTIKALQPDVAFSMQNTVIYGVKVPNIVYMHQSLPFQREKRFSFIKSEERPYAIYQYIIGAIIKMSVRKADKVIVQTQWVKEEVCIQCRISPSKVVKIFPTVNQIEKFIDKTKFDKRKFFYPTSIAIYKNNELLLQACKELDEMSIDYDLIMTLNEAGYISSNVHYTGRLPYEQVIETYNQRTLVFPSYIETFGYPLVEARALGTIILASDCVFSRELLGDYINAYFFSPWNVNELVDLMKKVALGEIPRKDEVSNNCDQDNGWAKVLAEVTNLKVSKDGSLTI